MPIISQTGSTIRCLFAKDYKRGYRKCLGVFGLLLQVVLTTAGFYFELARQKRPELIDWVGLTNRCNNNEQVIREVTETFFESSPANIEALTEDIKNNEKSVCKK